MTDATTAVDESKYTYDVKSHRFRAPNGRYVSASEVTGIRDLIIAKKVERTAELVNALYDGVIGPNAFVTAMRLEIKRTTMMQYMLGRGERTGSPSQTTVVSGNYSRHSINT